MHRIHWPPTKVKHSGEVNKQGLWEIHDRRVLALVLWDDKIGRLREDGWIHLDALAKERPEFIEQWMRNAGCRLVHGHAIGLADAEPHDK